MRSKSFRRRPAFLSHASHKAKSHRLNSFMVDQILLHALEKGEQLSLLLGCRMANAVADVDEEVGNPGKQVLVTGPMQRRHHLIELGEVVLGGVSEPGRSQSLNGGRLVGQRGRIGSVAPAQE